MTRAPASKGGLATGRYTKSRARTYTKCTTQSKSIQSSKQWVVQSVSIEQHAACLQLCAVLGRASSSASADLTTRPSVRLHQRAGYNKRESSQTGPHQQQLLSSCMCMLHSHLEGWFRSAHLPAPPVRRACRIRPPPGTGWGPLNTPS
jgi:hypothetical protein